MKTKKELEDDKKRAETEAAAHAYVEFMATFDDQSGPKDKVWVKAGTFDAGRGREDSKDKGKLYKPTSKLAELAEKFSSAERAQQPKPMPSDRPERPGKKKEKEKKKSNLEIFKEELKAIQEERAERHRLKSQCSRDSGKSSRFEAPEEKMPSYMTPEDLLGPGSYDAGDPATTNIYLGNLSPKITEQRLMELFGRFGPLASIKIMWPRTDNEKNRGRNCGFVAYMNRKDGERALANLNGKDIDTFEMKLGWGKAVPIPLQPIYIPPSLREMTLPPPPSGLPFNAQPDQRDQSRVRELGRLGLSEDPTQAQLTLAAEQKRVMDEILQQAVVKVVVPTERSLLQLIHRTIEFVVREGPMFEAMIMNRELSNPCYRFLFENQGPAHVYYRWKLFSILHGDSTSRWNIQPFRMFEGGSIWKPPPVNPFLQGMPDELIKQDMEEEERNRRGSLSTAQRGRLEHMIRVLTPERSSIGEATVWCIEHADAAREICTCLTEALSNDVTPMHKKIARLYLVSDILHNCTVKVSNASFYRKGLHDQLQEIFEGLHSAYNAITSRLKAEGLKTRVLQCCRVWEEWAVYPPDFLCSLQNIFLGLVKRGEVNGLATEDPIKDDVDGTPLDDVDGLPLPELDGLPFPPSLTPNTPLLASSAAISALMGYSDDEDDDLDGAPLDEASPPRLPPPPPSAGTGPQFVPPKWESVSPGRVEAQAMTLSKWDTLEPVPTNGADSRDSTPVYASPSPPPTPLVPPTPVPDDIDGVPILYADYKRKKRSGGSSSDEAEEPPTPRPRDDSAERADDACSETRRARLREVEVRVVGYEDELERGVRSLKAGYTQAKQVQHYRHKLLRKIEKEEQTVSPRPSSSKRRRSRSNSPEMEKERSKYKRSRSPHKSRRRSRSPRKRRSRSRSPPRKHKKKRH